MISNVLNSINHTINIPVSSNYVGSSDETLFETLHKTKRNASFFKGILTEEEAIKYHNHIIRARKEWDRDI